MTGTIKHITKWLKIEAVLYCLPLLIYVANYLNIKHKSRPWK